jgi:CMP/dCMP kinase
MIISISGVPGSGKGSVAEILKIRLNLDKHYSVGNFRREKAKKGGLSLEDYNVLGEREEFTDIQADEWQKNLGKIEDNFIIDGRLSFYFIPNSVKIFLNVNPEEGAKRILHAEREGEKYSSYEDALEKWHSRIKSDMKRYSKYYGINPYDYSHYDFVLNTSGLTIEEVVKRILGFLGKNEEDKDF